MIDCVTEVEPLMEYDVGELIVPSTSRLDTNPPGMLLTEPSKLIEPLVAFETESSNVPDAVAPANFGVPLVSVNDNVPLPLVLSEPDTRKVAPSRLSDELPL